MAAANAFKTVGTNDRPLRFIFMSGMGATQEEPGMFTPLFARVKGAVERELRGMETDTFKTAIVRPGGILPTPEVSPTSACTDTHADPSTRPRSAC